MKKTIIRVLIGIAAIVAVLVIVALTKPNTFSVHRSVVINAAPSKIEQHIDDFHQWTAWSPFEKMDTAMQRTYSGADQGIGAVYEWNSNTHAGSGRMEIIDTAGMKIIIKLDFIEPMEAHNTALFYLQPEGDSTKVTWEMYGDNSFMSKVMSIFFDMDSMVGKDFEDGLASLKSISES